MFGSARSLTYHATPDCRQCRVRHPVRLDTLRGKRACPVCVGNVDAVECTACAGLMPAFASFSCGHAFCRECAEHVISSNARRKARRLACPCGGGFAPTVSAEIMGEMLDRAWSDGAAARTPADHLNSACPHCDAVFYDFDGCLALRCDCGGFFCALCFKACASNQEAHAHARECASNPNPGELYLSMDAWHRVQARRREAVAAQMLSSGTASMQSLLDLDVRVPLSALLSHLCRVSRAWVRARLVRP